MTHLCKNKNVFNKLLKLHPEEIIIFYQGDYYVYFEGRFIGKFKQERAAMLDLAVEKMIRSKHGSKIIR